MSASPGLLCVVAVQLGVGCFHGGRENTLAGRAAPIDDGCAALARPCSSSLHRPRKDTRSSSRRWLYMHTHRSVQSWGGSENHTAIEYTPLEDAKDLTGNLEKLSLVILLSTGNCRAVPIRRESGSRSSSARLIMV